MPQPTYTALATVTLGSSASSVTFSSIPATYRDLILVTDIIPTSTLNRIRLRFNGDTGSNFSWVNAGGNGSATFSSSETTDHILIGFLGGGFRSMITTQVMDYSATDKHTAVLSRDSTAGEGVQMRAGRWANTAAVTSVNLTTEASSFASGTTLSLYGVIA